MAFTCLVLGPAASHVCPLSITPCLSLSLTDPFVKSTCPKRPTAANPNPNPRIPRASTGEMGGGGCCDDCGSWWDDWKYCLACIGVLVGAALFAVLLAAYGFVRHIDVAVEDASLTRFDLVTSPVTAFAYNLTLTLTIRNPNWAMSLRNTKPLEAAYRFDDQQFDRVQLADKGDKHGPGKTRVYHLVRNSNSSFVALGNAGEQEYRKEKPTGTFAVDVVVAGEVRYTARYTKCKVEATCPLKLQLAPPGAAAVVFQKVKCKPAKPEKNC